MNICCQAVLLGCLKTCCLTFSLSFCLVAAKHRPLLEELRNGNTCDACRVGTVEWVQEAVGVLPLLLQVRAS